MPLDPNGNYTTSALRVGDKDPYPQRLVGEFIGTVVSNASVNEEYKHVVLKVHEHALKAYAGQMFHLLCPSPDGAEVWMRRPMSVYRVDKPAGQVEFLYKTEGRGTRGMKTLGKEHNIPGQVAMEQIMVCGFGACYVCMRTFEVDGKRVLKRVCRDGPVFNMQEAVGW